MSTPTPLPVDPSELELIAQGRHGSPHAVLGPHPGADGVTVRVLKPLAKTVVVRYARSHPESRSPVEPASPSLVEPESRGTSESPSLVEPDSRGDVLSAREGRAGVSKGTSESVSRPTQSDAVGLDTPPPSGSGGSTNEPGSPSLVEPDSEGVGLDTPPPSGSGGSTNDGSGGSTTGRSGGSTGEWAELALTHEHEGIWVGVLPVTEVPDYRLKVAYDDQPALEVDDPYRFLPTLGELDLHLVNEGRHERLWDVLGAHVHHYEGPGAEPVSGTSFAVWAPHAQGVRLKADFNHWDGREHPMRQLGTSGVWELFVPGVGSGSLYKYVILGPDGEWREKADPMAGYAEVPPQTSSRVFESDYEWGDADWLAQRASQQPVTAPMSVYELHLGSWRRGRSYRQLADELVPYLSDLGFTHVELMPVMQHPFGGSWGYHVTSYFAPDSRYGTPDDFRHLVDRLHQAGIGVILDWVPGHFATDPWALVRFDGTPLYEDPNPQRGWHKEWGSHIFNFGRREVRNFLVANAIYWLEEFHADGLRVDGVASMLYLDYARGPGEWSPNVHGGRENLEAVAFLQEMNATVYKRVPGITTIAEESTSWPGVTRATAYDGLGFGFKWNMGWMHDTLGYLHYEPVHRGWHHHDMTFALTYAWSENYVLPLSHDEVVHGKGSLIRKMPGDRWQQLANLRAYFAFMWAHPGKQLLFMGGEFGQESEWAESRELDWWLLDHPEHRGLHSLVRDLNAVYAANPALWSLDADPSGFAWIDADDNFHNVYSFIRHGSDPVTGSDTADVVCVSNFSAIPRDNFPLGFPSAGVWEEIVNTDADVYAGSGVGNYGAVTAVPGHVSGQPAHATVVLPPLATIWFRKRAEPDEVTH